MAFDDIVFCIIWCPARIEGCAVKRDVSRRAWRSVDLIVELSHGDRSWSRWASTMVFNMKSVSACVLRGNHAGTVSPEKMRWRIKC